MQASCCAKAMNKCSIQEVKYKRETLFGSLSQFVWQCQCNCIASSRRMPCTIKVLDWKQAHHGFASDANAPMQLLIKPHKDDDAAARSSLYARRYAPCFNLLDHHRFT